MKSLKKTMLARIKDRQAANRTDYIDFNQLDPAIIAVAIDAVDSLDLKGRVVFQAGRPVAYSDPVHLVNGRWIFTAAKPGMVPTLRPAYVAAAAINGPLPAPEASLRVRPGSAR